MSENEKQTGLCDVCSRMAMDSGDMMASAMHNDHHPMCQKYVANFAGASKLLGDLVKGIDYWASQEDGVPDEIWDAYCKAKFLTTGTLPDAGETTRRAFAGRGDPAKRPQEARDGGREVREGVAEKWDAAVCDLWTGRKEG